MGASSFIHVSFGETAKEAFNAAVKEARYDHGHAGYTGTMAEKDGFIEIELLEGNANETDAERTARAEDYANKLIDDGDPRIDDKWGPAGCLKFGDGKYLFFGWASA